MGVRTKASLLLLLFSVAAFAANGSFVGQVVNGPNLDSNKKWVFVQGPRGPVRRVEISAAKISFSSSVAKKERDARPEDAVREGAQVRVTASQDGQGEWKASAVEIVKAAPK
jgi:hypothetical protein